MSDIADLVARLANVVRNLTVYSEHGDSCSICYANKLELQQIEEDAQKLSEKATSEWFCICGAALESKDAACPKGCFAMKKGESV